MNNWQAAEFLAGGNDMPQLFGLREPSGDGASYGTDGAWSWTINPDGTADLFRRISGSFKNTGAYGSMYFSESSWEFPRALAIKSIVSANVTPECGSGLHCASIKALSTTGVTFYTFSSTSGTFQLVLNLHLRVRL